MLFYYYPLWIKHQPCIVYPTLSFSRRKILASFLPKLPFTSSHPFQENIGSASSWEKKERVENFLKTYSKGHVS